MGFRSIDEIERCVTRCRRCPRLVAWREEAARRKPPRFRECDYWARPVPGFGDPTARLLIVGLAPAAHGGNRTGRMFTGDRSGDWLFRALHKSGFANHPQSVSRDDGLHLRNCFVSATTRCAPPANKPETAEIENCREYLEGEAAILWPRLKVVVVLGRIAFEWWIAFLRRRGTETGRPAPAFGHLAEYHFPSVPALLCSFHPSQQNTNTGKLTEEMFDRVWERAEELMG